MDGGFVHYEEARRLADLRRMAADEAWRGAANTEEAVAALRRAIDEDPDLYRAVMVRFEGPAIHDALGARRRADRRSVWARPAAPDARVGALAAVSARTILDLPLPSGVRLADATREDLQAAILVWRRQAEDMAAKADFCERVAARLPEGATVRAAFDVSDLEALRDAG